MEGKGDRPPDVRLGAGLVRLEIDGREVEVPKGTVLLEAARLAGIEIPHLCFHPRLPATACCRLCLVVVSGSALKPACVTRAEPGMTVRTASPEVIEARRGVLAMLRSRCLSDCEPCRKSADCRLRGYCLQYEAAEAECFRPPSMDSVPAPPDDGRRFFIRDNSRCVLCRRCLNFCVAVQGTAALAVHGRGDRDIIVGDPLRCVSCGNCVELCPAGALEHRYRRDRTAGGAGAAARRTETVCGYCGAGCRLEIETAEDDSAGRRIVGVRPADGPANRGFLCVKGAYGWGFISHPDRLTRPLRRRAGAPRGLPESFEPVSWDEALDFVAERLAAARDAWGPEAVGGLSSAKCTNEENYLFQKLFREGLSTNNIDHCARL